MFNSLLYTCLSWYIPLQVKRLNSTVNNTSEHTRQLQNYALKRQSTDKNAPTTFYYIPRTK